MGGYASTFLGRARLSGERMATNVLLYAIVGLLLISSYVAAVVAGAIWLSALYGAAVAAALIAGGTLVLAAVVLLAIAQRRRHAARRLRMQAQRVPPMPVAGLSAVLLPMMVKSSPIGSLVAVAAAAYVLSKAGREQD